MAPGMVAAGAHVAVMDYSPAPAVSLDEIVRQTRAACCRVHDQAAARGADPAPHHFDIVLGLGDAADPLCQDAVTFMQER